MKRKMSPPAAEEECDTPYQRLKSASSYISEQALNLVQSTLLLNQEAVLVDKELVTFRARNQSLEVSTSEAEKKAAEAEKRVSEAEKRATEAEKRAAEAEKRAAEAEAKAKRELTEVEKELAEARKVIKRLGEKVKQVIRSGEHEMVRTYRQCAVEARDRGVSVEHFTDKIKLCDLYLIHHGLPILKKKNTNLSVKDSLSSTDVLNGNP